MERLTAAGSSGLSVAELHACAQPAGVAMPVATARLLLMRLYKARRAIKVRARFYSAVR
jgi:hypothetical protein